MGINDLPDELIGLVQRSRAGERRAFEQLILRYQRDATELAIRILGDRDAACEAVQEGFFKAYVNIGRLRRADGFGSWLLRIIANEAINCRRFIRRRQKNVRLNEELEDLKGLSAQEKLANEELGDRVREAMLKLTEKQAKAIGLFAMEGLSQKEAAEVMGCSVEAIRWHVFQAKKKLRVLLKDFVE
ncbi:MAG: RNA polymerase sigma factor [Planctomycetota bacterium]